MTARPALEEPFAIDLPGYRLAGVLHLPPQDRGPGRLITIAHGLFSSMASPKLTRLARTLAGRGLAAARFDAQGCGLSGGEIARTTLTGRAAAIRAVMDHLLARPDVAGPPLALGSSFGGTASLWLGAEDKSLAGVIAWSAPSDFKELAARWRELEEEPLGPGFFEDLQRLDLPGGLAGLGPVLQIHGENDEVVPLSQALELNRILGQSGRLVIVPGADHRLSTPGALEMALKETLNWLTEKHFCCQGRTWRVD